MRRGVVFGHRDLDRIVQAMHAKTDYAVMSGIKPSGEFHLGTLMTSKEVLGLT